MDDEIIAAGLFSKRPDVFLSLIIPLIFFFLRDPSQYSKFLHPP